MNIEIGHTYEVPYPFIRDTVMLPDDEGSVSVEGWAPGVVFDGHFDDSEQDLRVAGGMGAMLLTVAGVYKPGKYSERVFYVRQWRAPDGRVFGKKRLQVTTSTVFRGLLGGYRFPFEVED